MCIVYLYLITTWRSKFIELQLKRIFSIVLLIALLSCSKAHTIEGNWGSVDEKNNYSELFIEKEAIRVYSSVAGIISPLTYFVEGDSLFTNILNYKIINVSPDSTVLESELTFLYLKRIKEGVKLSDYMNENLEDAFLNAFFTRMYKRKGIEPHNEIPVHSFPVIKEEVIVIKTLK